MLETIEKKTETQTQETSDAHAFQKQNAPKVKMLSQESAEQFLIGLQETLSDVNELKETALAIVNKNDELEKFREYTLKQFNALIDSTNVLNEKLQANFNYEEFLKKEIENAELSKSVHLLELQLEKQKSDLTLFTQKISQTMDNSFLEIVSKVKALKQTDDMIDDKLKNFRETIDDVIENKFTEFAEQTKTLSDNKYETLQKKVDELLKKHNSSLQNYIETTKIKSIDFLKQCESENKKLVSKVPAINRERYSKKEIMIVVACLVSVFSNIALFFLR